MQVVALVYQFNVKEASGDVDGANYGRAMDPAKAASAGAGGAPTSLAALPPTARTTKGPSTQAFDSASASFGAYFEAKRGALADPVARVQAQLSTAYGLARAAQEIDDEEGKAQFLEGVRALRGELVAVKAAAKEAAAAAAGHAAGPAPAPSSTPAPEPSSAPGSAPAPESAPAPAPEPAGDNRASAPEAAAPGVTRTETD